MNAKAAGLLLFIITPLASIAQVSTCEDLVPMIVEMSVEQETQENPAIVKMYEVKELTENLKNRIWFAEAVQRCGMRSVEHHTCPYRQLFSTPLSQRVLDCVGTARFQRGPNYMLQFYLDRDADDGTEWIGYQALMER